METAPGTTRESILREAHLRDYWKVIWQARWTVLAVFVLGVGLTGVWTFVQTPIFRATAILEVEPKARQLTAGQDVSGIGAAGYGWFAEEKYHNTQMEIIRSRDISARVFQSLDLYNHPRFVESPNAVDAFRAGIQVVPRRETGLIEISMVGANKEEITQWVNEVAQAYVDRNFEKAQANMNAAFDAVQKQFEDLKGAMTEAEAMRFETLEASQVVSSEHKEEIVRDKLKKFDSQLTEVQLELSRLGDTLQRVRAMQNSNADLMSLPELADDAQLKELNATAVDLEGQLERARVELRPGHPDYEKIEGELAKLQQSMRDRVSVILGTLQNKYDGAKEYETFLKEQIRSAEELSVLVARETAEYDLVKTQAEMKKRVFDLIARTMNEVQLGAQLLTNNVSVLDGAMIPLSPIKPRKRVNLMIGACVGLFLGLAVAFFLDYLDNTFRTPEDVEKYLGLAVLAVVPKTGDVGLSDRGVKEAYQSLRTSVIFSSESRQRKIILVSSAGPQEGKSSVTGNLARTLAAAGERVIVLDCDLRRPTQHLVHELERDHGITNYLSAPLDVTDWSGYVKPTTLPNLHLLTCGPIPPSPPELLGSSRLADLLETAKQRYDWILIDSPPAASLTDASLLAAMADMVVLVVRYNHTDRDMVMKAAHSLRSVNPTSSERC